MRVFYFKRTKKTRGTMWYSYNNICVWVLDWLVGFANIFDGLISILSLGFIGSDFAFRVIFYKLRFMDIENGK